MRTGIPAWGAIACALAGLLCLFSSTAWAGDPAELCWMVQGDQPGSNFAYSVASAGDVNGDGYDDVIVGAFYYGNGQYREGGAFVFHGSPAGLSNTPDWMAEGNQKNGWYGISVASAGDVNGDGYSDVIVGASLYDKGQSDEGCVFVYHGSPAGLSSTPDWTAEGNLPYSRFGTSVASAGDVNGDGYSDVIVGASHYVTVQHPGGRAFVYHGGSGGLSGSPAWTAHGATLNARFGTSVASAGDIDGDGYSDVVVGSPNHNGARGQAVAYFGGPSGLSATASWIGNGDQANSWFGNSVASAGDVNGDGYSEVIVGSWLYDKGQFNEGCAFMYMGGPSGPPTTPSWVTEGGQSNAYYGYSVACCGDCNGDGCCEVIIGSYQYGYEGAGFVYCGEASGPPATPCLTLTCGMRGARFGNSVACAGDVNGDGVSDIIVGAPSRDLAFVYCGIREALPASVDFDPNTLNLGSKGKYVTCYIELPEGFEPGDVDVGTVLLNNTLPAMSWPTAVGDHDVDGIPDRMVKFGRGGVISIITDDGGKLWAGGDGGDPPFEQGDEFEVTVSGMLGDGTAFIGTDLIIVIDPPPDSLEADCVLAVRPTVLTGTATISYGLEREGTVTLRVYDIAGRLVRTLVDGYRGAGGHELTWDRRNSGSRPVGAGIYIIRLEREGLVRQQKVVVVK